MEYFTYILWSSSLQKFYVGHTDNLIRRIQDHIGGKSKWTSQVNDWKLVYSLSFETRKQAIYYEKKIKKRDAQ